MLFKQVACILAVLAYSHFEVEGQEFDRCSVGHQKIEGMWVNMNLTDFENNTPKKNEILRTKAFMKGKYPAFWITNNGNELNFGKTRDNVWRIIYFPVDDFESFEDPCFQKLDTITFSENSFNEIHFILRSKLFGLCSYQFLILVVSEDGVFSVTVVTGPRVTVFSCQSQVISFDGKSATEVGFVTEDGKKSFLYDCYNKV